MKGKTFLLLFLIVLPIFGWAVIGVWGQVETKIYVDPAVSKASPGETFVININIANVKNLYGYQFYLKWNASLLEATSVIEGSFLNAGGAYKTFFVKKVYNDEGRIEVYCTLKGERAVAAASGSGTLATITFLVKAEGYTVLELYETELRTYDLLAIPHYVEDGYFQYFARVPKISVEPSSIINPSLPPSNTFNINISVTQAVKLYAWSLKMSWDPAILNVSKIEEGHFLNQDGTYKTIFNATINQEEGYLYASCTLESPDVSTSGNGTLAIVTFFVKAGGTTVLHIYETTLLSYDSLPFHEVRDGYFSYVLRDVAIVNVEVFPNKVKAGDSISITVMAKNKGTIAETFDVTVYYDSTPIGTQIVRNLEPGAEKILTFNWSTKGVAEGDYVIKAETSGYVVSDTRADGSVTVMAPE